MLRVKFKICEAAGEILVQIPFPNKADKISAKLTSTERKPKPGQGIDSRRALSDLSDLSQDSQIEVLEQIYADLSKELGRIRQ
ncbi:hypothetical protein RQN30_01590 [Arcanobacterium hippocoleae]